MFPRIWNNNVDGEGIKLLKGGQRGVNLMAPFRKTEVYFPMDQIFKSWLKVMDDYVIPFLRSKNGMYIICALFFVLFIAN